MRVQLIGVSATTIHDSTNELGATLHDSANSSPRSTTRQGPAPTHHPRLGAQLIPIHESAGGWAIRDPRLGKGLTPTHHPRLGAQLAPIHESAGGWAIRDPRLGKGFTPTHHPRLGAQLIPIHGAAGGLGRSASHDDSGEGVA
ncbi:hypothetical protein AB0E63_27125 [Kribbella sp. NPDC026596]|uniref:hypothetical protein n=1 Tax=Kribbella sp. NPDC026596 TaxID=3155122 RepID=UPI0033FD1344